MLKTSMLSAWLVAVLMSTAMLSCHGQAQTVVPDYFYPFGPELGDGIVPRNDDGSTGRVDIGIKFPFFNNLHEFLFVNTNGAISFLTQVSQYTPDPFPLANDRRLVAPFWADVDTTRNNGKVYYRETTEEAVLQRATEDIRQTFVQMGFFRAVWAYIVTWHDVTYYGGNTGTKRNTFQAVLITNGRHSFAIFNYANITWTTGTASGGNNQGLGGTPAQAGFNAGDGVRFFSIPGSRTANIINVEDSSNVGQTGRWMFRIDVSDIDGGGCNTAGSLVLGPRFGSPLGGKNIAVVGPCYRPEHELVCRMNDVTEDGEVVDETRGICITPPILRLGRILTEVSLNGGENFTHNGTFITVDSDPDYEVSRVNATLWDAERNQRNIEWQPDRLDSSLVDIEYVTFSQNAKGEVEEISTLLLAGQPNSGSAQIPVLLENASTLPAAWAGAIRIKPANVTGLRSRVSLWSDLHAATWYFQSYITEVALQRDQSSPFWPAVKGSIKESDTTTEDLIDRVEKNLKKISHNVFGDKCDAWYEKEGNDLPDFDEVEPPPCTLQQARRDTRFKTDPACNPEVPSSCDYFHKGAYHCFRQSTPSASGAGQQACYDKEGNLLPFEQGGGTYDRAHTDGHVITDFSVFPPKVEVIKLWRWDHVQEDVLPFMYCCKWSKGKCWKYGKLRPTADCKNYRPPRPAVTFGDPHIISLDGKQYTFNGWGEYTITSVEQEALIVQGRTGRTRDLDGQEVGATVWQAFALKTAGSDTVQLQTSELGGMTILVNGQEEEFNDMREQPFTGTSIRVNEDSTEVTVKFHEGSGITVTEVEGALNFLLTLSPKYQGKTRGLLGNWDGSPEDDLRLPNGTFLPADANDSSIFHDFGQLWMTEENTSLFTYPEGRDHSSYQHVSFKPTFQPEVSDNATLQKLEELCGSNAACRFDFLVTGSEAFANATKKNVEDFLVIVEETKPVITCGFIDPPANGVVVFSSSVVGATATFDCPAPYRLEGASERVCQPNGAWSEEQPSCLIAEKSGLALWKLIVIIAVPTVVIIISIVVVTICCIQKKRKSELPI